MIIDDSEGHETTLIKVIALLREEGKVLQAKRKLDANQVEQWSGIFDKVLDLLGNLPGTALPAGPWAETQKIIGRDSKIQFQSPAEILRLCESGTYKVTSGESTELPEKYKDKFYQCLREIAEDPWGDQSVRENPSVDDMQHTINKEIRLKNQSI